MYSIRQEQIREYIEQKNVVTIKELCALFPNVSLMTIHRDLDALERNGSVVKFRGGAKSVRHTSDVEFNVRMLENNAGKDAIARKAHYRRAGIYIFVYLVLNVLRLYLF